MSFLNQSQILRCRVQENRSEAAHRSWSNFDSLRALLFQPPTALFIVIDLSEAMTLLQRLPEPWGQWLALIGPVGILLLVLSVVSISIIVFKLLQLLFGRFHGRTAVNRSLEFWNRGQPDEAISVLKKSSAKSSKVLRHAMRLIRHGSNNADLIREEIARIANDVMVSQRRHLRALEVIGMVSPLLGLMGTVIGMIDAFQQLELGGSQVDPSVLSGGIWTALLTTGIGLAVAIPAVLAYHWLDQRFHARAMYLDDRLTRLFTAPLYSATS